MTASVEWSVFGLGLLAGALGGALFFGGLAIGIRVALGRPHAVRLLLASAALRIALLSGLAVVVAAAGPPALAGFAAAFALLRSVVLVVARVPNQSGARRWS